MEAEFRRVEVVVSAQAYRDQRCFRVHGEEEREITAGHLHGGRVCVCVCVWMEISFLLRGGRVYASRVYKRKRREIPSLSAHLKLRSREK